MIQQVSMEIMEFVETQILPKYTEFGESHGLRHVNRVIKNSLELARITGADINMVYVVAAYHDLFHDLYLVLGKPSLQPGICHENLSTRDVVDSSRSAHS